MKEFDIGDIVNLNIYGRTESGRISEKEITRDGIIYHINISGRIHEVSEFLLEDLTI